jgi:hypothetical protein
MASVKSITGVVLGLTVALGVSLLTPIPAAHAMGKGHAAPKVTPTPIPTNNVTPSKPLSGADSCVTKDPDHICIGLKLVSYEKNNVPVTTEAQAIALVQQISNIWSQCNIGFQLETYQSIDPTTVGLAYDSNWQVDGDTIRSTFNDGASFLVVTLGKLAGSTIGVTEMPKTGIYGSLIEDSYAQNPLTVGHELGHYQGLYHVMSSANLMYAYIGAHTSTLTSAQCTTARATDLANWSKMIRK